MVPMKHGNPAAQAKGCADGGGQDVEGNERQCCQGAGFSRQQ